MHFSLPLLLAALSAVASAQNPFTFTTTPVVVAGTPFNITWAPSTGTVDTVTLVLRQGDPAHLVDVATIAGSSSPTLHSLFLPPPQMQTMLTNGPNSGNSKHRLLPLDTAHNPRQRLRLRLRDPRRPE